MTLELELTTAGTGRKGPAAIAILPIYWAIPASSQSVEMVKREHRLRIAFCHPDLGLGGAERLVVDAACELCSHGHTVRTTS